MISLYLLGGRGSAPSSTAIPTGRATTGMQPPPYSPAHPPPDPIHLLSDRRVLYSSTRPAIIPYTSPLVSDASRLLFLAYYIFYPYSDTNKIDVVMAEEVSFARGSGANSDPNPSNPTATVPSSVYVELQAGQSLQVYDASVTLTANLAGLRHFMWYHRVFSFAAMTMAFWLCEIAAAVVVWLFLASVLNSPPFFDDQDQSTDPDWADNNEEDGKNDVTPSPPWPEVKEEKDEDAGPGPSRQREGVDLRARSDLGPLSYVRPYKPLQARLAETSDPRIEVKGNTGYVAAAEKREPEEPEEPEEETKSRRRKTDKGKQKVEFKQYDTEDEEEGGEEEDRGRRRTRKDEEYEDLGVGTSFKSQKFGSLRKRAPPAAEDDYDQEEENLF